MTAPLFDTDMMIEDLHVQALSERAQFLLFKIFALANKAGGFLLLGEQVLTLQALAGVLRHAGGDIDVLVREIAAMGFIEQAEDGAYFVPFMAAKAELRAKRRTAGRKGGVKTTAGRADVSNPVCLSNVIYIEKTKAFDDRAKKEKRTKKEKNIKYIYTRKIDLATVGSPGNPAGWFALGPISFSKLEYQALLDQLPVSDDQLTDLLGRQARWLEGDGAAFAPNWLPVTLSWLKKITGANIAAA